MNRATDFARFADLFAEALLLVGANGRIHGANGAARRQLLGGAAPEDEMLEAFVADAPEKVRDYLKICSRSSERLPAVLTFRREGGEAETWHCEGRLFGARAERPALVLLRVVPKSESVHRFVALNQRIDELREEVARRLAAERTAREQQELLHVTLASIGDGVITTDDEGAITFMNGVAAALTGWTLEEAREMALEDVFVIRNEETGDVVESPVRKVLREGTVVGLANHTVLVSKDGTHVPIDDSGAPIRDRGGQLFGVVLVFHEISERRKLERELLRQAEALREADRRKNEFLAMLAHELRNPLASLRNVVQLLQLHGSEADFERLAEVMDRQTAQLTRLVDDLLDVARITRGTIRLAREPVPLARVVDHALETVRPLLDERGHRVAVERPPEATIVSADLARLSQVFSNLLTNAAKFTAPGGKIELVATAEGDRAVVSVSDTGSGMDPELLARVFDLFAQGAHSLERSEGGLGIGLTLVKTLVEMHGGDVVATSAGPGCGSTFTISLPVLETAPARSAAAAEQALDRLACHVLIVDDNRDAAESLATLLTSLGCRTRTAMDGPTALDAAGAEPPDLVLLDIGLPGMDGYEVARRLRRMPTLSSARIVALSGYAPGFGSDESGAALFDEHLTKPVDFATLRRVVARGDE